MKNIKEMQFELVSLRERAENITQILGDGIRSSKEQDKMSANIAKIVDLQNDIASKIALACSKVETIESAIKLLPEKEQYLIRLKYVRCLTWEQICFEMNYSWRNVHRIHNDALKLLSK
jgi:DNA-directed RNA polymerase specialized sigma24 family protein